MKLFKVKGIVIKEIQYKDNDKIITLLTDEFGKISCLAKGAKKNNSPLLAACQLFVYSEFVKGVDLYGKYKTEKSAGKMSILRSADCFGNLCVLRSGDRTEYRTGRYGISGVGV